LLRKRREARERRKTGGKSDYFTTIGWILFRFGHLKTKIFPLETLIVERIVSAPHTRSYRGGLENAGALGGRRPVVL